MSFSDDKSVTIINNVNIVNDFMNDCERINRSPKNKSFCCIDIEFNRENNEHKIGIIQLMFIFDNEFYYNKMHIKPIYIFNLKYFFTISQRDKFIDMILCNENVIKIFHGSDSLDYKAIYKELIKKKTKFIKFLNSSVDTLILCQFSKNIKNKLNIELKYSSKCSIYYALYDHNIINEEQFNYLTSININYNEHWIITKLKNKYLHYAIYDVYYLYDLFATICNEFLNIKILSILNRLYRLHILNKFSIIDSSIIDDTNNKMIIKSQLNNDKINNFINNIKICNMECIFEKKIITVDVYVNDILNIEILRKNTIRYVKYFYLSQLTKQRNCVCDNTYIKLLKGNICKTILMVIKKN